MRLLFKKEKQKEMIKNFKNKNNFTWKQLSNLLKIKERRLKEYYYENSLIPELVYKKLDGKGGYENFIIEKKNEDWGRIKGGQTSKGKTKKIKIPKDSKRLAEFYGIMLGDGNLTKLKSYKIGTYMIRIVGDSRYDKEYLIDYVKPLIEKLFDIKVRDGRWKQQNTIFIEAHSVRLVNFLEKKGFKAGNKIKNKLKIPNWIKKNKNYLAICLRGLYDTDGSIYKLTNQNSHQINLKNYNSRLLKDVKESLIKLGIGCSRISNSNSITITKKSEIAKFFKVIGFNNSKHLSRVKMFGIAPSSSGQIS